MSPPIPFLCDECLRDRHHFQAITSVGVRTTEEFDNRAIGLDKLYDAVGSSEVSCAVYLQPNTDADHSRTFSGFRIEGEQLESKLVFMAVALPRAVCRAFLPLGQQAGRFGKRAIRIAWFSVAAPALVLNYFGQGALLIAHPEAIENPFYLAYPTWALYPMIALATAATIIASQATISGAYSMTQQAIQLGYLPRMTINHTSARTMGQIYVPAVNWILLVIVLAAVIGFGSSSRLASAWPPIRST